MINYGIGFWVCFYFLVVIFYINIAGHCAETLITTYADELISATFPDVEMDASQSNIHPSSRCWLSIPEDKRDADYALMQNSVENHTRHNDCCLREGSKPETLKFHSFWNYDLDEESNSVPIRKPDDPPIPPGKYCRFHRPSRYASRTSIKYSLNSDGTFRETLCLKRNNRFLNCHNKEQLCNFRANVDFQLIIDPHLCITYLKKYATKAEKMYYSLYISIFILRNLNVDRVLRKLHSAQVEPSIQTIIRRLVLNDFDRDMSAPESCHNLMQLPYAVPSFKKVYITLKSDSSVLNLDENLCLKKTINHVDLYINRPSIFLSLSLFQLFSSCYFYHNWKNWESRRVVIYSPMPTFTKGI